LPGLTQLIFSSSGDIMPPSSSNPDRQNIYLESDGQLKKTGDGNTAHEADSVDDALDAFLGVMKRFDPSESFDEAKCRQIVEAALCQNEIGLPSVLSLRKKMVSGIAEALMSDETSRSRLEAFWNKQKGTAQ